MRKTKKFIAILLAAVMAVSLLAAMPLTASAATFNSIDSAAKFNNALSSNDTNIIMNITGGFTRATDTYSDSIRLDGKKSITINLNNNTLNITATRWSFENGISLLDGATFTVNGPGTMNITAGSDGISAKDAGSNFKTANNAIVNITTTGTYSYGIRASDSSSVSLAGNITGGDGVYASYDSVISVTGNVKATGEYGYAAEARYGSTVTVSGNVTSEGADGYGAYAYDNSTVNVYGNVTATGYRGNSAHAWSDSVITVSGNVTASGGYSYGAYASSGGKIYVNGNISGTRSDIYAGGTFSVSEPVKSNVVLPAPYNGYYWDEFSNERYSSNPSYVYKRQGAIGSTPAPLPPPASGDGWNLSGGNWYYYLNGVAQTGWIHDGSAWYYMSASGVMSEGWIYDGSAWYYLRPGSGAMATGWILDGGIWYYLKDSGAMANNEWLLWNGFWYYLKPGGAMAADEWIDGYYLGADGVWLVGAAAGIKAQAAYTPAGITSYIEAAGTGGPDA